MITVLIAAVSHALSVLCGLRLHADKCCCIVHVGKMPLTVVM